MERLVFRVQQLPPGIDRLGAVQLISEALGIESATVSIFSLACSASPFVSTKTATITFEDTTDVRAALRGTKQPNVTKRGDDEWIVKVHSLRDQVVIVIDTHF